MSSSAKSIFAKSLSGVPEALCAHVEGYWQRFSVGMQHFSWENPKAQDCLRVLPRVWACSEFVAHTCLVHPQLLAQLIDSGDLANSYADGELAHRAGQLAAEVADEAELKRRLRIFRRREMLRIAWRDLAGWAELSEVMSGLSELADACIDSALVWLYDAGVEKHGMPLGEHSGEPVSMVVLGLGKLGGYELNFSSDVDLIFAYPEPGVTTGKRGLSNHEFFLQLGRRLINVLSEATADGFVFRVDTRLRPNGTSGPLALGFDAMEQYYQAHGREWERYALIKARVVAGDRVAGESLLVRLRPFIYRKYVDYGAVRAIREMKAMINRELQRKGMRDNIKLGPGGIREIEFAGQVFQLIRGGREPALQERSILNVLDKLGRGGHLAQQTVQDLAKAYVFLRNTENRLQMIADRQVHILPREGVDQPRLATAMGFREWQGFDAALRQHMRKVQQHFDELFAAPESEETIHGEQQLSGVWLDLLDRETAHKLLTEHGFDRPDEVIALLRALRSSPSYAAFSSEERACMDQLVPLLLVASGKTNKPIITLPRLVNLVEAIGRRSAYLVLLIENPMALSQLVNLCAASPWIANWISQHPVLLDELLDPASLYAPPTRRALEAELRQRLAHAARDDLESQMEILREFRHGHVLRVAAADIGLALAPERVAAHLVSIVEVVLEESLHLAHSAVVRRHGEPLCRRGRGTSVSSFAIIGYGKLGSIELGYASDLDIIFLYDACPVGGRTSGKRSVPNEVFFARLSQRLIHILTTRTRAGLLYEVDMRLRPSGRSGPLITSLDAFRRYQREKAWTWEHQALVRARAVAGEPQLRNRFAEVRREILCNRREHGRLRDDVKAMRDKMIAAQTQHDPAMFDVKHDRGGIVDIEFMVQYWVLLWAADCPQLADHTDNISILKALTDTGLLEAEWTRVLVDAYRRYLSTEHRLKLTEHKSLMERHQLAALPEHVAEIWREVFEQPTVTD